MRLPKCPKHPKYQAKRQPVRCLQCFGIWRLKELGDRLTEATENLFKDAFDYFKEYGGCAQFIESAKRDAKALTLAGPRKPQVVTFTLPKGVRTITVAHDGVMLYVTDSTGKALAFNSGIDLDDEWQQP